MSLLHLILRCGERSRGKGRKRERRKERQRERGEMEEVEREREERGRREGDRGKRDWNDQLTLSRRYQYAPSSCMQLNLLRNMNLMKSMVCNPTPHTTHHTPHTTHHTTNHTIRTHINHILYSHSFHTLHDLINERGLTIFL